jgi:hypothetical protein
MRAKTMRSMLQYGDRTPVRWLRAAAASLEERLAARCVRQWSYARASSSAAASSGAATQAEGRYLPRA